LGSLGVRDTSVLSGVVDEQGSRCDLSTDVAELCDEAEDHVVLLVKGSGADDLSICVDSEFHGRFVDNRATSLYTRLLLYFRKLGAQEEYSDCNSKACNCKVDILDCRQVLSMLATEEKFAGNQRTNEGRDTVP